MQRSVCSEVPIHCTLGYVQDHVHGSEAHEEHVPSTKYGRLSHEGDVAVASALVEGHIAVVAHPQVYQFENNQEQHEVVDEELQTQKACMGCHHAQQVLPDRTRSFGLEYLLSLRKHALSDASLLLSGLLLQLLFDFAQQHFTSTARCLWQCVVLQAWNCNVDLLKEVTLGC